jgi:hypothetical protein
MPQLSLPTRTVRIVMASQACLTLRAHETLYRKVKEQLGTYYIRKIVFVHAFGKRFAHKSQITNHKSQITSAIFRKTKQSRNPSEYNQHIMTEFTYIHSKLSKDYTPADEDILCARGKAYRKHPGNKKFSAAIRANLQTYSEAPKRVDKSNVVVLIVRSLRENGGRFIKQDKRTKQYYELTDGQAHRKTGHAIRDLIKCNNGPSSSISRRRTSSRAFGMPLFRAFDMPLFSLDMECSHDEAQDNRKISASHMNNECTFHADLTRSLNSQNVDEVLRTASIFSDALDNKSVLPDSDISESLFHVFDDEDDMKAADIYLNDKCYGGTPRLVTPGLFASSSFSYDDFERVFEILSEDEGI